MTHDDVQKKGSIFIYSDETAYFDFGPDHPFKPERAFKTFELCNRYGVINHPWMRVMMPEAIDRSLLSLFHDPHYIELLEKASRGEVLLEMMGRGIGTEDNPILPGIFEWSLKVTGGACAALDLLMSGEALVAFNPLGGFHHAGSGRAEGFCYVNDIAVAIKAAREKYPLFRTAYIDIDAHHGNGVQEAFYGDPEVLFICIHETGRTLYPWSGHETEIGTGHGRGFTVNIPIEPGADDEVFDLVFNEIVVPLVDAFSPDVIVAELGADAMVSDPLTHLRLTNNSYQRAVRKMAGLCPRILALGGGGYDLYRTARCWTLAWAALNRLEPQDEFAGLVGGMMFGPEMEVGSLYDHPVFTKGEPKQMALAEARRVMDYLSKTVFPIHRL